MNMTKRKRATNGEDTAREPASKKPRKREKPGVYQQRYRDIRAQLQTSPAPDYPTGYTAPIRTDVGTAAEDYDFAQRLRQMKPTALTTTDVINEKLLDVVSKSKHEMILDLLHDLRKPLAFEGVRVKTHAELMSALSGSFNLIKCDPDPTADMAKTHNYTIAQLINDIGSGIGPAYMPHRAPGGQGESTHNLRFEKVRNIFLKKETMRQEDHGLNCLDIGNVAQLDFYPTAVHMVSLVHRIDKSLGRKGWARENVKTRPMEDWMILTKKSSTSRFHVDYAGFCTCVVGLVDGKVWHTLPGDWETVRKRFRFDGPLGTNYSRGVQFTEIVEGSCL